MLNPVYCSCRVNDDIERTLEIDVKMAKDIHTHNRRREPIHLGPFVIAWVAGSLSLPLLDSSKSTGFPSVDVQH